MENKPLDFIYSTDLHGNITKYEAVYDFAIEHDIKLIHLGADLLPKGSDMSGEQKKFVKNYLKDYYKKCSDKSIKILAFWGNDDLYTRKQYFKTYAEILDETPYTINDYDFKAYGYVQDYPFGLKTACKLDYPGWKLEEPYISDPVEYTDRGWEKIEDIQKYFIDKGTIQEDLNKIFVSDKTIMAIHQPPILLNLDVCIGGRRVGSKSVYDWIVENQPMLVLCGHIHENYKVTGIWKSNVGKTVVIQPGQKINETSLVYIHIEGSSIESHLVDIQDKFQY